MHSGGAGRVQLRRLDRAGPEDVPLLERFATDIYDRAFHDKHREPAREWIGRLTSPGDDPKQSATLALRGGRVVAGALAEIYPPGVLLLTYIVVHEDLRGQGLGSLLMRDVRRQHPDLPLFAEIADPARASDDVPYAIRRASVFRTWGWRALGCAYLQPPLSPGGLWASDLLLLQHGPAPIVPSAPVQALNDGLRRSLASGPPPEGLTHRYPPACGATLPTRDLAEVIGYPAYDAAPGGT